MNRSLYPVNWEAISDRIRFRRAGGCCECQGECGANHKRVLSSPILAKRCWAIHGKPHPETGSKVVLTVAHLDHDVAAGDHSDGNLAAMCQRCHLAFDRTAREAAQ